MKKLFILFIASFMMMPLFAQEIFNVPMPTSEQKYNNMASQCDAMIVVGINYAKSQGKSASEYGKYIGEQFMLSWNKELGFKGFANGMLYHFSTFLLAPELEIITNTSEKVKFKMHIMGQWLKTEGKYLNVTYEEYNDALIAAQTAIANYMGCNYELTYDENWMYIIISKK